MKKMITLLIAVVSFNTYSFEKKCVEFKGFLYPETYNDETEEPEIFVHYNLLCAFVDGNKLTRFSIQAEDDSDRVEYLPNGGTSILNPAFGHQVAAKRKRKEAQKICELFGFEEYEEFETYPLSWNPGGYTVFGKARYGKMFTEVNCY